jgi:hypothetical protein
MAISQLLRAKIRELPSEWQIAVHNLPRRRESGDQPTADDIQEALQRIVSQVELSENGPHGETAGSAMHVVSDEFALLRRILLGTAEHDDVPLSWRTLRVLDEAIDSVTTARTDGLRDLAARAAEAETHCRAAAQRQRFLAESSRLLAESLDHRDTLQTVALLAVPDIADWCVVDLVQDDGSMARVAVEHRDPEAESGPAHVVHTGKTEIETHISESALQDSYISAPLPDAGTDLYHERTGRRQQLLLHAFLLNLRFRANTL